MPEIPPQILKEFLDQSAGLLDRVDQDLADVDRTGDASRGGQISSAFRSIRSGAAFLELADLETAATNAESLLRQFDAGSLDIARRELATLRAAVDTLRTLSPAPAIIHDPSQIDHAAIDAASRIENSIARAPFEPATEPANTPVYSSSPEPAIDAASRIEDSVAHAPFEPAIEPAHTPVYSSSPEPLVPSGPRTLATILEQSCTVVANVAARTSRDLRAEISGGEVEADDAICAALHSALNVIVAHVSSHTARCSDPNEPVPVIRVSAESECAQICIRVESPAAALDSWASDPHLEAARNAVESMMGSLTITADSPSATSIALRLPANPSRFDAMLIRAANTICALPIMQVEQILTASGAQITGVGRDRFLQLHGESIPLLDAPCLFAGAPEARPSRHIVILRAVGRRIALSVDRALGRQEVELDSACDTQTSIDPRRGTATLEDGSSALVIDIPTLVRSAEAHAAAPVAVAA